MPLLAILYPWVVDSLHPVSDVSSFRERLAVRAVIYDGPRVALIHVGKHDYYMLPGGGTDGEEPVPALQRELREELGCNVTVEQEVGKVITYIERWRNKQIDTGFICQLDSSGAALGRTDFEQSEGHAVVWAPSLSAAIALAESAVPDEDDGKAIRARDLLFLRAAQQIRGD